MGTGIKYMIDNRKDFDLHEAYNFIVNNSESLKFMALELEPYIRKRGDALYQDESMKKDQKSIFIYNIF